MPDCARIRIAECIQKSPLVQSVFSKTFGGGLLAKQIFKITILNWEKHNKSLKKGYTHFMVSKRIFNDEKIANLKPIEFQLYMYLLAIAADMVSNQVAITVQLVPKYMRISQQMLRNCLSSLEENQLVTTEKNEPLYNIIEYNIKEKNIKESKIKEKKGPATKLPETVFDFESLYEKFPRKIGKASGIQICKRKIKTQDQYDSLNQAILNYAAHCQRSNTESKYIKHFSTFMNCWEDWLEVPLEKQSLSESEKKKISINYDLMEELHNGTETNSDASSADGGSFWNSFKQDES